MATPCHLRVLILLWLNILRTSSLVTRSAYGLRTLLRQHLISAACILLYSSVTSSLHTLFTLHWSVRHCPTTVVRYSPPDQEVVGLYPNPGGKRAWFVKNVYNMPTPIAPGVGPTGRKFGIQRPDETLKGTYCFSTYSSSRPNRMVPRFSIGNI